MRLILSRKGFDSSAASGGCASPILPDGQMISLPIPHAEARIAYSELQPRGLDIAHMVADLTRGRVVGDTYAHLDPDLDGTARGRQFSPPTSCHAPGRRSRTISRRGAGPRPTTGADFRASQKARSLCSILARTPKYIVGPRPKCRLLHNNKMEPTRLTVRAIMALPRAAHFER